MTYTLNLLIEHANKDYLETKYNDTKQYISDIGIDLYQPQDIIIEPYDTILIDLGIKTELIYSNNNIANNCGFMLVPRSSIYKTKIRLANSIGIIDPNYRGIIKAAVDNISNTPQQLLQGERYFQLIFTNFNKPEVQITDSLSNTDRGNNGFGSTSIN